jgi:hypothetical protein
LFPLFATGVVDTCGNLPPALLTPVANFPPIPLTLAANLPPVSTTSVELVSKFATGVVDTGGAPLIAQQIFKKFEMTLVLFSGLGEDDS